MADLTNDNLVAMIDQVINDNDEQAKQCFHDYLKPKLQINVHDEVTDDIHKD